MKTGRVTMFLRLEGLLIALVAILLYVDYDLSWWWFVAGFILPDLFMAGYWFNNKTGALIYNIGHTLVLSLGAATVGYLADNDAFLALGLAWTVHIGLDRMLGFGLKHDEGFKHTHLGKIISYK